MSLLVQSPTMGLNALVEKNLLDPKEAASGSQNVLYEYGVLRTAFGFSKMNLTAGIHGDDAVYAIFGYRELDGYDHIVAVTSTGIFENDSLDDTWSNITQAGTTMKSSRNYPISYITCAHNATETTLNDAGVTDVGYHLVVCNGGRDNIQRWAGRLETDFANVTGGGGYHDGTTHRALQIGQYYSRPVLISPYTYSSTTGLWTRQSQRVQYAAIGKLQDWSTGNAGFVDLLDTGGQNVWSAQLNADYIIYQDRGIWSLNYVGGKTVYSPRPYIQDIGLLAPNLLVSHRNVHYFVGTNYNIYSYYGGTVLQNIGEKVQKYFKEDLETDWESTCWMSMDVDGKRLWIFIVPSGGEYVTKAYGMDIRDGSWMVRDFSGKFTSGGITAANLIGAQVYYLGESYNEATYDILSSYDGEDSDSIPQRYGDTLMDTSRTNSDDAVDTSAAVWTTGGLDCTLADGSFNNDFTDNDIMLIVDGSKSAGVMHGTHFYTVYDVSTNGFSVRPRHFGECYKLDVIQYSGSAYEPQYGDVVWGRTSGAYGTISDIVVQNGAWADGDVTGYLLISGAVGTFTDDEELDVTLHEQFAVMPAKALCGDVGIGEVSTSDGADMTIAQGNTTSASAEFYSVCSYDAPGDVYRELIEEVQTSEQMVIGTSDGYVYQFGDTLTDDDGTNIDAVHYTPVFDMQAPEVYKRWTAIAVVAKGTEFIVEYQIDDGDWIPCSGERKP